MAAQSLLLPGAQNANWLRLAADADGAAVSGDWFTPEHGEAKDAAQHRQNIRHRPG